MRLHRLVPVLAVMATLHAAEEAPATGTDDAIIVTGAAADGSEAQGYRVEDASQVGPLGAKPLVETPYSLQVVSGDLLRNLQATSPDDVVRLIPVAQLNNRQTRFFSGIAMRGFSVGSNKRVDGMPNANMIGVDMEDKERVEVLTGLSGFLYGPGNVGGTVNYVLKRPTEERLTSITVGTASGASLFAHGDFGGPIDRDGTIAYRVNVLAQDGDTAVDHQSITRRFVSGAIDWRPVEALLLQVDASYSDYHMTGNEPYWATTAGVKYPEAPDADDFYGQPWTTTDTIQDHVGARLRWQLAEGVALRAGATRRTSQSDLLVVNNTFIAGSPGDFRIQASAWEYPDITNTAGNLLLDARFATGSVEHTLTAGWFGDRDERTNYRGSGWSTITWSGFNIAEPSYVADPGLSATGAKYTAQRTTSHNLVVGDEMRLGAWSLLAGVNYVRIADRSYDAAGNPTADYDDARATPTATIAWRPVQGATVYANYIESLEKGGTAAATYNSQPVTNAEEIMPPLVSTQYELGAKVEIGQALLTAALFHIDKGLQYYDVSVPTAPTYVQDGRQVHRGVELTAAGRVLSDLTIYGGVTLLDAQVKENAQNPALEGKTPINVAERMAKLYAEYDLPWVAGLTLTGGVIYTGSQQIDAMNTDAIPSSLVGDAGARFRTTVLGPESVLRLSVTNITNEGYWLTPNSLGAPRSVALSLQTSF